MVWYVGWQDPLGNRAWTCLHVVHCGIFGIVLEKTEWKD